MGRMGLSAARDAVRSELWPLPALGVTAALVLGIALPLADEYLYDELPSWMTAYLFGGRAEAARTVLAAIAGSLITVTSLTFSLTVVTLQLASSQYSPRLLRTFSSDQFVQSTLALFLGTFTFSLTVLRTVRTGTNAEADFVPQISVTTAFALAVASVVGLVLFLAHLVKEIRVETVLRNVHHDASATVRRVFDERHSPSSSVPAPPAAAGLRVRLTAGSSGFLLRVNEEELLAAAIEADAVICIDRAPGSSVIKDTPVGMGWSRGSAGFERDTSDRLRERVAKAISTGAERAAAQDPELGLRQMTDVATRALSPGINDPTTAIYALGHASSLLCEMAARDLGPRLLKDENGNVRAIVRQRDFDELLDLAVEQPLRYGAADPQVLSRIGWLLREVGWIVDLPEHRRAVARQLTRLRQTLAAQHLDDIERGGLAALIDAADQSLTGRWPAGQHVD